MPPQYVDVASLGLGGDGLVRLHVGEYQHGDGEGLVLQDVYEFVVEGHGGVPGLPQRALLLLRPVVGLEIPFASSQGILSALDIQAEAAHVEEPQGNVELG